MKDGSQFRPITAKDVLGTLEGESTDANEHAWLHDLDDLSQCLITAFQKRSSL